MSHALSSTLAAAAFTAALIAISVEASGQPSIEYKSVAEARRELAGKPGATSTVQEGWLIIQESDGVSWSFAPQDHEAHPSVAKRTLIKKDGRFYVETAIVCEAAIPSCDRLVELYKRLDERMNEAVRAGR